MSKPFIKILTLTIAILLVLLSAASVNALSTYEDGDLCFANTDDESFVSLYSLAQSATADEINVSVPDSSMGKYVNSVYAYAFYKNQKVKSVDFSNTRHLNTIDNRAFSMSAIQGELILPATLTKLGYAAFQECKGLTSVTGGSRLSAIPDQCFCDCNNLTTVYLPRNLESIGRLAFADCPMLQYIFIPESVNNISDNAFNGSYNTVIYCYYNSYAYTYAKNKNISYVLLDGVKLGDTDGDGYININDVTAIQRHLALFEALEGIYLHAADANQNGEVKIDDATILQRFLAEYEIDYPVGEVMTQ